MQNEKKIDQLNKALRLKQMEINSLLEITSAINNNLPAADLFKIFIYNMRAIHINRMAMAMKKDVHWEWVIHNKIERHLLQSLDIEKDLLVYSQVSIWESDGRRILPEIKYIIPVFHKDEPLAFVLIEDWIPFTETKEDQLKFIQTITNIITVAIENKRLFKNQIERERISKELDLATRVQNLLVPEKLPNDHEIELSAIYLPQQDGIGGDYYDYISLSDTEHLFCVADVSGKGISAAMLMSNFQAQLRALAHAGVSLKKMVEKLNERVEKITRGRSFIALIIAKYNDRTKRFSYINCGQPAGILVYENQINYLKRGAIVLGALPELPFLHVTTRVLKDDAIVFFYSDGLMDQQNEKGEYFNEEIIADFVLQNKDNGMQATNLELMDYLNFFRGKINYADDITVLSCRIKKEKPLT